MRPPPSRHHVSWADLTGAPVGVWGLGVEGRANLRKLASLGVDDPVLVDDRPGEDERVIATDAGGLEALARCRYVVKTPGIPRYRPEVDELEAAGVPVLGGLGLWLEEADRDRVVCITGTKGKSTTASVMGHLLRGLGRRPFIGGNLGLPPYDPDADDTDADVWVVEVSSYQATDVASSPGVVGVTSLSPDHLDWHGDVEAYYRDKLSLCAQDGARITVANGDDPEVRARAGLLGLDVEWIELGAAVPGWVTDLGLLGRHNHRNALLAQRCLVALGVDGAQDEARLTAAAEGFAGLDSRLQVIGEVDGVTFVDDSLSTNVLPTMAAMDVFDGRAVALLAGGFDRDIDYRPLARHLAARPWPTLVLALPSSGGRLMAALEEVDVTGPLEVVGITARGEGSGQEWLPDAVARAHAWARGPGGVVLLSPAAASFDHFADYADRGRVFADAMRALSPGRPA